MIRSILCECALQVYKAIRRGVQEVAVKRPAPGRATNAVCRALADEIRLLESVSFDRNIVQYYGSCLADPGAPILVMEYMAVRKTLMSTLNPPAMDPAL